jgi:2-keto-4-pentenoate hydratase/2-oxohepta-3-ene-1,7-dioic acid hydratase in catechol pathway
MRLVTYLSELGPRAAALRGDELVDLEAADPTLPTAMRELLALGPAGLARAAAAAEGPGRPWSGIRLLAPVPDPQKIVCIGLNYADHA